MQIQYFKDLSLSPEIMRGVEDLGFTRLFPIQAQAIGPLLEGRDVIGQAQTGTGKTAAFGIPMIERLDSQNQRVQGLILEPTRELAEQVAEHVGRLGRFAGVRVLPVYGGESIQEQIRQLREGVHIVVGTPGRLLDLLSRRALDLTHTKVVVLDEADRMLDMGFIEDIEQVLSHVPVNRQTGLFSATIDDTVMSVCHRYMKNPEMLLVSKDEIALTQIRQYYTVVNPHDKFQSLCELLDANQVGRAIIFCKTRTGASWLADGLRTRGYDAMPLHAGFSQPQRNRVMDRFRQGRLRLLVATDVAARGLDVQDITHVINYDVPLDALVYFHRIGRTARMGLDGTAITLVGYGELPELEQIKALTKTNIEEIE